MLLLLPLLLSQEPAPSAPLIRTSTRLVQVNVVVRDKNGPVAGLLKEDFAITEKGKSRTVAFFAEHKSRGAKSCQPTSLRISIRRACKASA